MAENTIEIADIMPIADGNKALTPEQAMDLLGQVVDLIKSNLGDVAFINFPEA